MNWRVKALLQGAISVLREPYSEEANQWVSRRFGRLGNKFPDFGFGNTLTMIGALKACGVAPRNFDVLEIGTGWSCLSALTLAQLGTRSIRTIDLYRHVRDDMSVDAMKYVLDHYDQLPADAEQRGLRLGSSSAESLKEAGIVYEAPVNVLELSDWERYDLIYAQAVLEHIPAKILRPFMEACYRLLRPKGICYQYAQPADHYSWAPGAKGVSPYNFLKYSDWWFNLAYNPRVAHQNRWRCSQYLSLFKDIGFEIEHLERTISKERVHELDEIRLAPQFRDFDREDLATEYFRVVLRKP